VIAFLTGGSGVLGRALRPLLEAAGHEVRAPGRIEFDLFDPHAVARIAAGADAVYHLATRIPPPARAHEPEVWRENDRLRTEGARILVDAALKAGVQIYVQPTVTFVYPHEGPADEETPIGEVSPRLRSARAAEQEAAHFAAAGGRSVVLRLGLLDGPGTGNDVPNQRFGATLHVDDAGRALLAALSAPPGLYNVVRDGERVSNARFKQATGWQPER
jgi:nucleoside-diphosphate-sugar epimerase